MRNVADKSRRHCPQCDQLRVLYAHGLCASCGGPTTGMTYEEAEALRLNREFHAWWDGTKRVERKSR